MRVRLPLLAVLAAALIWVGCEEQADSTGDSDLLGPVFAKGGAQCDTKGAPVRDYFLEKDTRSRVNEAFRDLATGCANFNEGDLAVTSGFAILAEVEQARNAKAAGDPADGALVVAVAWNVMQPWVCAATTATNCDAPRIGPGGIEISDVEDALDLQGAFGVRYAGSDPVISSGNDHPDVVIPVPYWGIEPFSSTLGWSDVLPGGRALIMGYPDLDPVSGLSELPLGAEVAYDWTVLPWFEPTTGIEPLSVTVCAEATPGNKEKVAHRGTFLEDGRDSWCDAFNSAIDDPLLTASGLGADVIQFARSVIPFWPDNLHATALGKSGSGKATEFSPYFGYQLDPEGLAEFITVPGNATAFDPYLQNDPSGSNLICAAGATILDDATTCPPGSEIRVHLTTSNRSPLSGDETVFVVVTAQDNNGSWEMYGTVEGARDDNPGLDPEGKPYGLVYAWNDLALDKPGAYKLHTYRTDAFGCVFDDDGNRLVDQDGVEIPCGPNSVGIAFPAATSVKFNVNP